MGLEVVWAQTLEGLEWQAEKSGIQHILFLHYISIIQQLLVYLYCYQIFDKKPENSPYGLTQKILLIAQNRLIKALTILEVNICLAPAIG